MARIMKQSFLQDPVMGTIGRTRIQFTGNVPLTEANSVTFPTIIPGSAVVINQINATSPSALVASTATGTFDATIGVDGTTITIAGVVYTLRAAALSAGTVVGEFVAPAVQATKLANFINVVNGIGDGTAVGTGATPHPLVYAEATGTAGQVRITCKVPGVQGNRIVLAETPVGAIFAWDSGVTAMSGGSGTAITAATRASSTTTLWYQGFTSGDIIDVITAHGSGTVNFMS